MRRNLVVSLAQDLAREASTYLDKKETDRDPGLWPRTTIEVATTTQLMRQIRCRIQETQIRHLWISTTSRFKTIRMIRTASEIIQEQDRVDLKRPKYKSFLIHSTTTNSSNQKIDPWIKKLILLCRSLRMNMDGEQRPKRALPRRVKGTKVSGNSWEKVLILR